jgi:RNA polymerase sigma-70 factor (ECF subfamily)
LRHFLTDAHDRFMAQKRGGGVQVDINATWAEELYATEPVDKLSPDRLYQRRWALTVLEHSLQLLAQEFTAPGNVKVFAALRPFLGFGPDSDQRYDEIAATLGIPVGTLKNKVFRLRQRWRKLLFDQVAMTLDDPSPERIKGELWELLGCV